MSLSTSLAIGLHESVLSVLLFSVETGSAALTASIGPIIHLPSIDCYYNQSNTRISKVRFVQYKNYTKKFQKFEACS